MQAEQFCSAFVFSNMALYSIKDLEKLSGIKAHTIRIWEQRYSFLNPIRTKTNIRQYSDSDLKELLNCSVLYNNGFKISKIAALSKKEIKEIIIDFQKNDLEIDNHLNQLVGSMIALDESTFMSNLNHCIELFGFEKTVTDILYTLMEKVGVLWQIGTIKPSQEHFISSLVRQKFLAKIDEIPPVEPNDKYKFLLALPENEFHEIGLLFCQYLLKVNRYQTIYLGQNVPYTDLDSVVKEIKPDIILTAFINPVTNKQLNNSIDKLKSDFPTQKILINGNQVNIHKTQNSKGVQIIHNISELIQIVNKL